MDRLHVTLKTDVSAEKIFAAGGGMLTPLPVLLVCVGLKNSVVGGDMSPSPPVLCFNVTLEDVSSLSGCFCPLELWWKGRLAGGKHKFVIRTHQMFTAPPLALPGGRRVLLVVTISCQTN